MTGNDTGGNSPSSGLGRVLASRQAKLTILAVLVVFLAGCGGLGGGDGGDGSSSPAPSEDALDMVPTGVDGVMYFDSGIIEDQTTEDLADGFIQMAQEQQGSAYTGPDSYQDLLDEFESQSDLSPSGFQRVTVFGQFNQNMEAEEYAGGIFQTDWTYEEIVDATDQELGDVEESSYNGVTVYISEDEFGEVTWLGDLGDGTFVVGTEEVVKDVIDVNQGDANAFSGTLRDSFENAQDGYMKAAFTVPEEQFDENAGGQMGNPNDIEVITMTYYTSGDTMNLDTQLTAASESSAQEFQQSIGFVLDFAVSDMEQQNPELASLLEQLEVSQDGNTVTIAFSTTPQEILDAIEQMQNQNQMSSVQQSAALAG